MTTLLQISIKFSIFKPSSFHGDIFKKPIFAFSPLDSKLELASLHQGSFKLRACGERWPFLGGGVFRNGVLLQEKRFKRKKRLVLVKNNLGFGFNGGSGGGGGGGRDNGESARILGNLALAIGLTYLSMTGQLGWILDVVVSIWIFAVLIPIVGLGAFLWWAGRDIMQGTIKGSEMLSWMALSVKILMSTPSPHSLYFKGGVLYETLVFVYIRFPTSFPVGKE